MITLRKDKALPYFSTLVQTSSGFIKSALSDIGQIIRVTFGGISSICEDIDKSNLMIMPDHVHFIINVKKTLEKHLGYYIGKLKGKCSRNVWNTFPQFEGLSVFENDFHDRIVMKNGQLKTLQDYLLDNPRRRWIKEHNPALFQPRALFEIAGEKFRALGNITLAEHFDISAVRVSSKFSPEELQRRYNEWGSRIREAGVLAGAFISKAEKEIRDNALANSAPIILLMDRPFPELYKPTGRWFDYCSLGLLLILAPYEAYPEGMGQRARFLNLNDKAEALAAGEWRRV